MMAGSGSPVELTLGATVYLPGEGLGNSSNETNVEVGAANSTTTASHLFATLSTPGFVVSTSQVTVTMLVNGAPTPLECGIQINPSLSGASGSCTPPSICIPGFGCSSPPTATIPAGATVTFEVSNVNNGATGSALSDSSIRVGWTDS